MPFILLSEISNAKLTLLIVLLCLLVLLLVAIKYLALYLICKRSVSKGIEEGIERYIYMRNNNFIDCKSVESDNKNQE